MNIRIENIGGIWYCNGKRLGYDILSHAEITAINEFMKEFKDTQNQNP
ncbi:MAG: hypothetical protein K0R36_591 [Chryseobacterium sp.]|jgi:hypothetical protein|nr:hypothetical protein [Chryseobacterium sp.]